MDDMQKKDDSYWKQKLTPEQYDVCRLEATEYPFSGKFYNNKQKGMYNCIACGQQLFDSSTKFDSGTGWPSFWDPVAQENIRLERDTKYGMVRTKVSCANCGAHLGHVFEDGPRDKTGMRYCLNSVALDFKPHE